MRLFAALLILLGLALPAAAGPVSADSARAAALAGEAVLVDIRTPEEWAQTGVPDAAHALNLRDHDFFPRLMALRETNPGKPLALICATGGRSTFLSDALESRGIPVMNVAEGVLGSSAGPGWLKRGLPVRNADQPRAE